ncbi:hypothetical protein BDU57DRAFT_535286 [Ampelomyces quisqualis]|uniref:Rhodopsin domain-containing protein n=1 Tax=Ampelomyces quisqualis TaxID=50730 RepID=A0A6A5R3B7_AMPQU|nr:hypothetical protein BDU57DRAFT_535286 [Ampelomyces quisqualis]
MARDDRSGDFVGVMIFFITLCTILVMLRCYCKLIIVKNVTADDYFSLLTLVSFLVFCALSFLGVKNGTGKRRQLIPDDRYPDGMKWWWSCEPTYVFMNIALKMSIGIFLLRIALRRVHRVILWVSLLTIQLYSIFFLLLFTFQCWPVSHFWERFRGGQGKCVSTSTIVGSLYGYSALSCVTDWTFSIVPIFIVQELQMSRRKKITVGVILAFCAIGSTATIVRLPFISSMNNEADFLYSTIDVAIWSTCETGIGLATSAVATLRPLLRKVLGDTSTFGHSEQKRARTWGGTFPTRSGYVSHPSRGGDNDIPLKEHDGSLTHIHVVNSNDLSPSGSTAELRDWEHEKESRMKSPIGSDPADKGGIMRTISITQT